MPATRQAEAVFLSHSASTLLAAAESTREGFPSHRHRDGLCLTPSITKDTDAPPLTLKVYGTVMPSSTTGASHSKCKSLQSSCTCWSKNEPRPSRGRNLISGKIRVISREHAAEGDSAAETNTWDKITRRSKLDKRGGWGMRRGGRNLIVMWGRWRKIE